MAPERRRPQHGAIRPDVVRDAPPSGDAPPNASGAEANIPEEYRGRRGGITKDKTGPHLKKFLEEGGTILAIGSSTALANQLDLPLKNYLVAKDDKGEEKPLGRDKFYVPGSVLQIRVDATNPLAWGLDDYIDVMFSSNPVFRIPEEEDKAKGLKRIAWFNDRTPLRSGWAWGQEHLEGGVAIASPGRQRPTGAVRPADSLPRPTAWDVQVFVQCDRGSGKGNDEGD